MRAVSKCTVGSVFDTVPSRVSLIDTRACLVVAKMVAPLSVSSCPMEIGTFISIRTYPRRLVIEGTVDVWTVVESAVSAFDGAPSALVCKVPLEASERPMLVTLVLEKSSTLLHSEFLQICVVKRLFSDRRSVRNGATRRDAMEGRRWVHDTQ